ncbi:EI24 domain-containing protein [Aliiroseovarius sp. PTFE2010]|uniref:EI24 domain-containing protein n=1 Tax=Aliiroseovarius sp. PTFE2010 TaxID=3417190 RepID=UPI003CF8B2F8
MIVSILSDFLKAIGQLGDRRFQRVLLLGVGLTILLLFAVYAVFFWFVGWITPDSFTLPWIGEITWVDNLLSGASILLMMVASVFLMVPVASMFTGFFLEDVADAVEDRHYPTLPAATPISFTETLVDSLSFLGVIVAANIAALLIYLLTNIAAPLVFWAMNGFLLGREYFQMVAMRHLGRAGAKSARRRHAMEIWIAGALMAIPLTVPVLNLLVPVLGVATFTHIFHRLARV